MVVEGNKLIANLLLAEHAVTIPGVGALRAVRRPAERLSRRRVRPAYYRVEYSAECVGRSLSEAIAEVAGCDVATAEAACTRWLGRAMQGDVLVLRGIGELRQKRFVVDPAFDLRLNPAGHEPLTLRRRHGGHVLLWGGAAAAIVCGAAGGGLILVDHWPALRSGMFGERSMLVAEGRSSDDRAAESVRDRAVQQDAARRGGEETDAARAADPDAAVPEVAASERPAGSGPAQPAADDPSLRERSASVGTAAAAGAHGELSGAQRGAAAPHTLGDAASVAQPAAGTAPAVPSGASSAWESDPADAASAERAGRMGSGRTYVVQGVYSTERNALRAARAASEAASEAVRCGVYRFGDKFMVSLFETDDAAAAAAFVRTHAGRFPETWPYKAR